MNLRTALLATSISAVASATSGFDASIRLDKLLVQESVVYAPYTPAGALLDFFYAPQLPRLVDRPYAPSSPEPAVPQPHEAVIPAGIGLMQQLRKKRRDDDNDDPHAPLPGRNGSYRRRV